ncbi:DNA-binding response regulator [Kitasatospora sp. NPDC127059]|uniref:helix-turn-helix transcriptional regulator n=1 Tax=unclassified Kitasatospora TaxID=2633591 RepID=UPI0036633249
MIRADILVKSPIYLIGLVKTLNDAGIRVISARTSHDDESWWFADAVLIDVDALSPEDCLARITDMAKSTAVLVLDNGTAADGAHFLSAGAAGVVNKHESGERIVNAVHAVANACNPAPQARTAAPATEATEPRSSCDLSEREQQVLRQIALGLTHGQIATRLGISSHTVDTYVKRIRTKLGVGNKAELTRAALLGRLTEDRAAEQDLRKQKLAA